jgi:2-oxoglutarate ferredoxin oxidoreductase subunit beta
MVNLEDYQDGETAWCPGCGNFGILTAMKRALVELGIQPYEVLIVSGVGQAGKLPHYMKCNVFNGLHGRTLPVASAAKLVNHKLHVFAVGGDGDGYAEGGNHLTHAIRRNIGVKYLVHDNQIYGLTKGQASPTSDLGFATKTTPKGVITAPFNPIALALALGVSFVARSFSGDIPHLVRMIKEAVHHRGFALIDILQPCVSFNHLNTYTWYRRKVYDLSEDYYDNTDRIAAFEKAQEWGERIPIGVFYKEDRTAFEEHFQAIADEPLVKQKIDPKRYAKLMEDFM